MKNHEWVDGKLLQTNKKYSHLKQKQKDKIYEWMYAAFKDAFQQDGRYSGKEQDEIILANVMSNIRAAEIWIPEYEVEKHYKGVKNKLNKRYKMECVRAQSLLVTIEPLDTPLTVCKVVDYSQIDISQPFCFTGATDEELSLVCPTELVPGNTTDRDDGWRVFRIVGTLDFALIGILAGIAEVLAANDIGIFAVSTYNTDYILTKEENYEKALNVLRGAGYSIQGQEIRGTNLLKSEQ